MARQSSSRVAGRFFMLSLLAAPFAAAVTSDFSFYPKEAQDCMYDAQKKTSCSPADTTQDLNSCLCGDDGGFVTNTAKCLRDDEVDADIIDTVFTTMDDACGQSQTPLKLSQQDWDDIIDDKDEATTTTSSEKDEPTTTSSTKSDSETSTTQSETSSTKATETNDGGKDGEKDENKDENNDNNDDDDSGLPTGAIVGIAVGGAAVVAIVGVLIWWWLRRRRSETPESDPMLAENGGFYNPHTGPTTYPPTEPMQSTSPGLVPAVYEPDHKTGRYSAVSGMSSPGISPAHSPSNTVSPPPVSPQTYSWGAGNMGYAGAQQQYSQNLHPGAYSVPPPAVPAQYAAVPSHHSGHDGPVFEMDGSHVPAQRPSEHAFEMPGSEPSPYSSYRS